MAIKNNRDKLSERSLLILNGIIVLIKNLNSIIEIINNQSLERSYTIERRKLSAPLTTLVYGKLLTFYRLLNGYSLDDIHPKMLGVSHDVITLYDLERSIYEAILQHNFILNNYTSELSSEYFIRWFENRAFSERKHLANTSKLNNNQLDKEEKEMGINLNIINTKFNELLVCDRIKFGNDPNNNLAKWPLPSKLYKEAGIHESQHKYYYKLLSLYAHSEPLAILQIKDLINEKEMDINSYVFLHGYSALNLGLIHVSLIAKSFNEVQKFVDNDNEFKSAIKSAEVYLSKDRASIRE